MRTHPVFLVVLALCSTTLVLGLREVPRPTPHAVCTWTPAPAWCDQLAERTGPRDPAQQRCAPLPPACDEAGRPAARACAAAALTRGCCLGPSSCLSAEEVLAGRPIREAVDAHAEGTWSCPPTGAAAGCCRGDRAACEALEQQLLHHWEGEDAETAVFGPNHRHGAQGEVLPPLPGALPR